MASKKVVLGVFPDEAAADAAVEALQAWEKLDHDVKLNAIGVLVADPFGKLKVNKMGKRSVGKGAGIGIVLAMMTPVGLAAGVVGGGLLGGLHHKGLGLSSDERNRLGWDLSDGRAAVGVLVTEDQAGDVSAKLAELGGTIYTHELEQEMLDDLDHAMTAPVELPGPLASLPPAPGGATNAEP